MKYGWMTLNFDPVNYGVTCLDAVVNDTDVTRDVGPANARLHVGPRRPMTTPPLHKYQSKAIDFCLRHTCSYQALSMGLGKTRIALEWAKAKQGGVLVIAPLRTVKSTWPDEIKKWTPEQSYCVLHGTDKQIVPGKKLYLINFDGLQWLFAELKRMFTLGQKMPFRAMVIDEGSMVKSSATKRFKVLKSVKDLCSEGVIILSGTPAPNSLMDLWSQYFLLDNGKRLGVNITKFRTMFFEQDNWCKFKWKLRSDQHAEEIHRRVSDITYRLDAADYLELPERIDNIIDIHLPAKTMQQVKELEKNLILKLEDESVPAATKVALSMKLRQVIQGAIYISEYPDYEVLHKAKLEVLKSLVEEASGQGILCAIQFKFELDMLREVFPKAPAITGGSKIEEFTGILREWNAGDIPLLICHPASLSHGVNLQAGSHLLVWYGLPWSLEHYVQLNARLHRQGQKNTVIIHHLVAKGTIDERVLGALQLKLKGQNALLDYLKETSR